MTYLAQSLVALYQTDKRDQAREVAARLFALAELEGYIRVYLDEGEPMRQVLQAWLTPSSRQHALAPSTMTYVTKLLAAFQQEADAADTSLQATRRPEPALAPSQRSSRSPLGLTVREGEVLRLLVAGRTYTEMAEELVVSLNTVKTQVSSIYRKLGVSRRAEAIAEAQRLHLL